MVASRARAQWAAGTLVVACLVGGAVFGLSARHQGGMQAGAHVASANRAAQGLVGAAPASLGPRGGPLGQGASPLRFDANLGQFPADVSFAARGAGYGLFLKPDGVGLVLQRSKAEVGGRKGPPQMAAIQMRVVQARAVTPVASQPLPGRSNYFVGSDHSKWREGVPSYARVTYPAVRPGLDLVVYGQGRLGLEYDLVLAPGTEPSVAALVFDGTDAAELNAQGELLLRIGDAEIRQPPPIAYQRQADGERALVAARYVQRSDGAIGFVLGAYDSGRELVIDPTLAYSTYLGGAASDAAYAVAIDTQGAVYVTGDTASANFPTAFSFQPINSGSDDAFVTKLSASGALVYSTFLGGSGVDFAEGIAVDATGAAYVTGATASNNFPTAGAFQSVNRGGTDAFVTKLTPSGTLAYSTYLGGSSYDEPKGIAVDFAGAVYVVGLTEGNFPTAFPFQGTFRDGGDDAFVTKLGPSGALVYSTYLGGGGSDRAFAVAVDGSGSAYCTGQAGSNDFPTVAAFQPTDRGGSPAFVTKFTPSGGVAYSTYLGGSGSDSGNGIAVDAAGLAYVTGRTGSPDFPIAFAQQPTLLGIEDAFVTKLSASGAPIYSTYLGGADFDTGQGITVSSSGVASVVGTTYSVNFPSLQGFQAPRGGADAFVARLSDTGSLLYSTYLGGSGDDEGRGIAVDSALNAYVVGYTNSINFPAVVAFQPTNRGGSDAFVAKLSPTPLAVPAGTTLTTLLLALLMSAVAFRVLAARANVA